MAAVDLKFAMGDIVRDEITGFTGTITGFSTFITGCDQYLVNPEGDDPTKYPDGKWLDDVRLVATGDTKQLTGAADRLRGSAPEGPPSG